ncbi:putative prophage single stranded DNA-binding protein [Escherichia coli]|nr:putative prophage single stranded DNA-binding protein [Escherichia coli]
MTAQIAAYGRLVDDPQVKQTSKGTPMTLARMAVSLPCSHAAMQPGTGRTGDVMVIGHRIWQTGRLSG